MCPPPLLVLLLFLNFFVPPSFSLETRKCFGAAAGVDGELYVIAGFVAGSDGSDEDVALDSVVSLDPSTGLWTAVAAISTARSKFGVAVLSGKIVRWPQDEKLTHT